jgi:hypothetical protein
MRKFSYGLLLAGALLTQESFATQEVKVLETSNELTTFFTQAKEAKNANAAVTLLESMDPTLRSKICTEIVTLDPNYFATAAQAGVTGAKAARISGYCQDKMREFKKQQTTVGTLEEGRKNISEREFTKEQAQVGQLGQKAAPFEESATQSSTSKPSTPVGKLGQKASQFEEAALRQAAEEAATAEREAAAKIRAAETEAAKQKALEEEAAAKRKAAEEEEAKMKAAQELEKLKAAEEEAAKQKAIEEEAAAKRKAAEEQEARMKAEEEARRKAAETEAARLKAQEEKKAAKQVADAKEQAAQLERKYQELQRQTELEAKRAEAEGRKDEYEKQKAQFEDRLRQARAQLQEAEGHIELLNMLIGIIREDLQHLVGFQEFSRDHARDNSEQYLDALKATLAQRQGFEGMDRFKEQADGASETLKQAYANYAQARSLLAQIQTELEASNH